MINEALLGASLVLWQHVAQDKSWARTVSLALHSANTMLLLGALALTALWCSNRRSGMSCRVRACALPLGGALLLMLVAGATGAVTALGDTLFPATSLGASLAQDFSARSHYLLRLRILHPVAALGAAVFLAWACARLLSSVEHQGLRPVAITAVLALLVQLTLGVLNILLLAPVWLQMVHLLVADVLWLALVVLVASSGARGKSSRVDEPLSA